MMSRRTAEPKPMCALQHDFMIALKNLCDEANLMLLLVETLIMHGEVNPPGTKEILIERAKALRAALMSSNEGDD